MTRDAFGQWLDLELEDARRVFTTCEICGARRVRVDRWTGLAPALTDHEADVLVEGFESIGLEPWDNPIGRVCEACGMLGVVYAIGITPPDRDRHIVRGSIGR